MLTTSTIFAIIFGVMAAISGVGSIISTSVANKKNRELSEENREDQQSFAAEQAQVANRGTESLYGELYSPSAKVAQMRNAGLSPGLLYSIGGAGGSSSTQGAQASAPSNQAPVMNPVIDKNIMGTLLNAMGNMADIENKESGTGVNEANKNKVNAEIKLVEEQTKTQVISRNSIELDNKLKEIDLQYKGETMQSNIDKLKAETTAIEGNYEKTLKEIEALQIDVDNKQKLYDVQLKKTAQDIIESKSRVTLQAAQTALTKTQNDKEKEEILKIIEETKRISKETEKLGIEVSKGEIELAFKEQRERWEILEKAASGNMLTGSVKLLYGDLQKTRNRVTKSNPDYSKDVFGHEQKEWGGGGASY